MNFEIPRSLQVEHEALHADLVAATEVPGAVGEAAREVARLLHPHFVREEEFALPPLALLEKLAREAATREMAEVLPMTRRLKAERFPAFDLLELYAFVRPASFCLPTAKGVAAALGLAQMA